MIIGKITFEFPVRAQAALLVGVALLIAACSRPTDSTAGSSALKPIDGRAGTLLPKGYNQMNHSFAAAAGGVISTADDVATWIKALVGGRVLDPAYQRRWLDSLQPEDPGKPEGQKYGYGIAQLSWGPNTIYFHGGETAGCNSKISYDPVNDMTLIVWTNLAVSLDDQQTANTLWVKVLDQIYKVSPLAPSASAKIEQSQWELWGALQQARTDIKELHRKESRGMGEADLTLAAPRYLLRLNQQS